MADNSKKNGLIIRGVVFGVFGLWLSISLINWGISMSNAVPDTGTDNPYGAGGFISTSFSAFGSLFAVCGWGGLVLTVILQVRIWTKFAKLLSGESD